MRNSGVSQLEARTGQRVDFGGGIRVDVLEPVNLSLQSVPAPVAYRVRAGSVTLLLLNREAVTADLSPLTADGTCLGALVLPARITVADAVALTQALHPSLVILSQPRKQGDSPTALQLRALLPSTRTWTATEGAELTLDGQTLQCRS